MKRSRFFIPGSSVVFGPTRLARIDECDVTTAVFRGGRTSISVRNAQACETLDRVYRIERLLATVERFATILAVCVLCACISASDPDGVNAALVSNQTRHSRRADSGIVGTSRKPTAREYEIIRQLMVETEQVRGLKFFRPVPVVIQDREAITAHIESEIEDSDLERAKAVYTALGLLDPNLDIRSLLLRVLGEQILGYYDPDDNRLVVRNDVIRSIRTNRDDSFYPIVDEARIDLVHELTHALQSQNLALRANMERERDNDAENAFRALIEGDATLAMIGYLIRKQQPDARLGQLTGNPLWIRSIASMINQMPMAGPELANAPPIVRVPLLSAYVDGLAFAANLHGRGGWKAIDLAHRSPPTSTEQVLHPERFLRGDIPRTITMPKIPALKKAGYELVEEDTLGELEIRIYFAQGTSDKEAEKAAEGWSCDRVQLYRRQSGEKAVIWFTTWDDEAEAKEAEQAAHLALENVSIDKRALFEVKRSETTVLIIRGLPKQLQREVLEVWNVWKTSNLPPHVSDDV